MPIPIPQPHGSQLLALVVSDSGLERHRLQKHLRRAGFVTPIAVDPWASAAEIERAEWDVVVWAAPRAERRARDLLGRMSPPPPVLLVLDDAAPGASVAAALAAGFADVVRDGAGGGELVARAGAVARRAVAGRALAAEVALFRELAESGRDLLARQAPDGTIRYASGAAREILAWDPGDLVGRRAPEILPAQALEADGRPHVHRVRRRDGGWVWMETTARVLHDGSGRVREIHTDSRDISERVRVDGERSAITRVTAAVAEGAGFERIATLVAREAAGLVGAESAAVVRFHGDEGLVLGAAGPSLRAGDPLPLAAAGAGSLVAPVAVDGRPWGILLVRGIAPGPRGDMLERLRRLAPLVGLAVTNSRSREHLVAQATTDPLTGLANHGAFHRRLEEECSRAHRTGASLTLVMIDLDHFKRVNDTHGHQVGDRVLREVAERLVDCARREDVTGRVGGEELAWLLPATDLAEGVEAGERLRQRIAGTDFPAVGRLTASLGVACLGDAEAAELARRADRALYRAKEGGRNACVAWADDEAVMEALFE